jgi:hypothetical protein
MSLGDDFLPIITRMLEKMEKIKEYPSALKN